MSFMRCPLSRTSSFISFYGWAILFLSAVMSSYGIAKDAKSLDQLALKERLREQILDEVTDEFRVERGQITVYLDDRRLVVPNCNQNFVISLPFSDRSTVAANLAKFMNSAGKIHERDHEQKKKTIVLFHVQFMNGSELLLREYLSYLHEQVTYP